MYALDLSYFHPPLLPLSFLSPSLLFPPLSLPLLFFYPGARAPFAPPLDTRLGSMALDVDGDEIY